jgi:hypothetical protein
MFWGWNPVIRAVKDGFRVSDLTQGRFYDHRITLFRTTKRIVFAWGPSKIGRGQGLKKKRFSGYRSRDRAGRAAEPLKITSSGKYPFLPFLTCGTGPAP